MPTLNLEDVNIYYERRGKGDPLVLIAGYSADTSVWYRVLGSLSQHFTLIVFDNRGAGKSSTPSAPFSLSAMAGDIKQLLDKLGISKAHILGHSMGSKIALEFAAEYPDLVDKLMLACGTTRPIGFPFTYVGEVNNKLSAYQVPPRLILENLFGWVYGADFLCNDEETQSELARVEEQGSQFNKEARVGQFEAADQNLTARLKDVQAPTLVVAGEDDLLISPRDSKFMAENLRDAQFKVFSHCAHMPQIEQPEEFVKEIERFLKG